MDSKSRDTFVKLDKKQDLTNILATFFAKKTSRQKYKTIICCGSLGTRLISYILHIPVGQLLSQ